MPKQKITKEMIVEAAFNIARAEGEDKIMAKTIAAYLNCSVQPIYSYCSCMDGLKSDLICRTSLFIQEFLKNHIDKTDYFKSTGHAYIKLAKEEPHLFKLYFFRSRDHIHSLKDLYETETNPNIAPFIAESLGVTLEEAKELHLNMLIYNMGIAVVLAASGPDFDSAELHQKLETAYAAFLDQIKNN